MSETYIAIDLKSFYASVECRERDLDPLTTNLVVADKSRTEKTICLAVSPSLKSLGIPGRPRLYEVVQKVDYANSLRIQKAPEKKFTGKTYNINQLNADPALSIDYIVATPRMAYYMNYSTRIYNIYLKYIAPEDIHVYSVDEVFIDVTHYLATYKMSAHELTMTIIRDILSTTGITATAGIGTNMYLCKIAMDIVAKKMPADKDGVRIAELNELSYRKLLWDHRPLTSFWRVGAGYTKKLEEHGMYTMGDIARNSLTEYGEKLLYKLFGINAELLIDHAWGWEPCRISDIKSYHSENNSLSTGQVLQSPYTYEKTKLIVREMTDLLVLDLVEKELVTKQMILTIGYDVENIRNENISVCYHGKIKTDFYGRKMPEHSHGTVNLGKYTSSTKIITDAVMELYEKIINSTLLVRRVNIAANFVIRETDIPPESEFTQLDFFTDFSEAERQNKAREKQLEREKREQNAILSIKRRFGKNAIIKAMNLQDGGTAILRNSQIGGHRA